MSLTPEEFVAKLKAVPGKLKRMDTREALQEVIPSIYQSVQKNYGRQTDETGAVWPPRKDNLPHPLLILSGVMFDASTGGLGSFQRVDSRSAEMGIRGGVVPYAGVHHDGNSRVPKRRFFYLHADEEPMVRQKFGVKTVDLFRKNVI